jgi:uncharacterized membrane protein (DUF485 family)
MSTTPPSGGPPLGTPANEPGPGGAPSAATSVYADVQRGADFARLRRSYRRFTFPMTVGFCAWYLLYVLLSSYAPSLMGSVVVGNVNVAFVLGVLQFLTTFAIAWLYARYAGSRIDPQAERIKAEVEARVRAGTGTLVTEEAR